MMSWKKEQKKLLGGFGSTAECIICMTRVEAALLIATTLSNPSPFLAAHFVPCSQWAMNGMTKSAGALGQLVIVQFYRCFARSGRPTPVPLDTLYCLLGVRFAQEVGTKTVRNTISIAYVYVLAFITPLECARIFIQFSRSKISLRDCSLNNLVLTAIPFSGKFCYCQHMSLAKII